MKTFITLAILFSGALGLDVKRAACGADNCVRAVTLKGSSSSRVTTDCSSFQSVTVYPSVTTTTVRQGSTTSTSTPTGLAGTTVIPSDLPKYVQQNCASTGVPSLRFASACSCAGVTRTTSTVPTPTATVTLPFCDTTYSSTNGVTYNAYCSRFLLESCFEGSGSYGCNVIRSVGAFNYQSCIDACTAEPRCMGVNNLGYRCDLLNTVDGEIGYQGGFSFAVPVQNDPIGSFPSQQ